MTTNKTTYKKLKELDFLTKIIDTEYLKKLKCKILYRKSIINNNLRLNKIKYKFKNLALQNIITPKQLIELEQKINTFEQIPTAEFDWSSFYKATKKVDVIDNGVNTNHLRIVNKNFKKQYSTYNDSSYLNIHLLYQDFFINKLINLVLLKKGRKYKAFNIFYKVLLILKKVTSISPIRIIKSILKLEKMVVTYSTKKTSSRIKKIPKFNTKKNLYVKYLVLLKKSLNNLRIIKHYSTSEKLAYIIIHNLLHFNTNWRDLIVENIQSSKLYEQKRLLLYKKY